MFPIEGFMIGAMISWSKSKSKSKTITRSLKYGSAADTMVTIGALSGGLAGLIMSTPMVFLLVVLQCILKPSKNVLVTFIDYHQLLSHYIRDWMVHSIIAAAAACGGHTAT